MAETDRLPKEAGHGKHLRRYFRKSRRQHLHRRGGPGANSFVNVPTELNLDIQIRFRHCLDKQRIHSLDIQISAADFKIVSADEFSVESNLKYLSVSEKNGILKIVDEAKSNSNYSNAT